jgi:hypothetical protein
MQEYKDTKSNYRVICSTDAYAMTANSDMAL